MAQQRSLAARRTARGRGRYPATKRDPLQRIVIGLAALTLIVALLAVVGTALSGFGTRMDWWEYRSGFSLLTWSAFAGIGTAFVSLPGIVLALKFGPRKSLIALVPALALGLVSAAPPILQVRIASKVPAIHDISTDLENPPAFVAIMPIRTGATNTAVHAGAELAEQQRRGYPDLGPRVFARPPGEVFELALAAAKEMNWEIVAAVPEEGRIEAMATTFWFGFTDDLVVRVAAHEDGSRVDVRSVSRVGVSDIGANARRIRKFLAMLPAGVGSQ